MELGSLDDDFDLEYKNLMCGELLVEPFQAIASHSFMSGNNDTESCNNTSMAVDSDVSNSDSSVSAEVQESKRQKAIRKPHTVKLLWSHKNSKKGKSYSEYIDRQVIIARKFCKQIISLFNTHKIKEFAEFTNLNYSSKFTYHESTEGVHPFTGTTGVDRKIEGIPNYIQFLASYFAGVPDGAALVQYIEISDEGKTVYMNVTLVGTPLQNIKFPGRVKNGSNESTILEETFKLDATIKFMLDKDNKMLRIELKF